MQQGKLSIIIGRLQGKTTTTTQAFRYPKDKWQLNQAKAHCEENEGSFHPATESMTADEKYIEDAIKKYANEPEFYELKDVDVVVKGKWKGQTFTDQMLDNIVNAFNELKGKVNVKFKFGHDDKQKLIQADGYPNIGLINSLKKVGDRIKAHIVRIPKKVMDLMNIGSYNEISPEINPFYHDSTTGKTYKNILSNVALLGEEHKAMTSLTDIHNLLFANNLDFGLEYSNIALTFSEPLIIEYQEKFNCECIKCGFKMKSKEHCDTLKCPECGGQMRRIERPGPGQEKQKLSEEEVKRMENEEKFKEVEDKNKKFEEENTQLNKDLEDSNAKIKTLEKEKEDIQKGLDKFAQEKVEKEINEFIEQGIKDGKILPAQKDNVFAMISAIEGKTVKFTVEEDGKPVEKEGSIIDLYKAIAYAAPFNLIKMSEETIAETEDKTASDQKKKLESETGMKVVDDDIDKKAKKYAEDHKVDYDVALKEVS